MFLSFPSLVYHKECCWIDFLRDHFYHVTLLFKDLRLTHKFHEREEDRKGKGGQGKQRGGMKGVEGRKRDPSGIQSVTGKMRPQLLSS